MGPGRLSQKDACVSCSTVAVTQQDTNHRSRWSPAGMACTEGLGAAGPAARGTRHGCPLGSSPRPWPCRGEDIHPDKHGSTPCTPENTGVDKRLILARRHLSCCRRVGGWRGPRGARRAGPGERVLRRRGVGVPVYIILT